MKISVCHQLLPLLLLLFCCRCLAAVHGKVDADTQDSIYKMTPQIKAISFDLKLNTDVSKDYFLNTNFSQADFPCPESAAIEPCTCSVDSENKISLDCTLVESVDQLVEVFQQDFPVKDLYEFSMASNSAINVFPSFMNGITFESVILDPGPFTLVGISEHFLFDLKDTLKKLVINHSKLATDFFPFFMLSSMYQLDYLRIYFSDINWITPIRAPKLTHFDFEYSPVELLVSGTFSIGKGPMDITLYGNKIHTIEVGSFFFADQDSADSNGRIEINMHNNQLQSLKAGTFPLRNGKMLIHPSLNKISSIEPGTFVLPAATDLLTLFLDLGLNELTTVDEAVFGSLMPFITFLGLRNNPLTCVCDMAWLITNADFLAYVDANATCADGINLHDLDPQQYIDFC